jgi:hypothetical protein
MKTLMCALILTGLFSFRPALADEAAPANNASVKQDIQSNLEKLKQERQTTKADHEKLKADRQQKKQTRMALRKDRQQLRAERMKRRAAKTGAPTQSN